MVDQWAQPKSASDARRERDVFSLHAAFRDIPHFEDLGSSPDTHSIPSKYAPKPASDASLAAFCQLAALRLNAARTLISLIDDEYQYILAEATPKTSLKTDSPLNEGNHLVFGNVRLPRRWGICEKVLDPSALAEEGIIVINDFTKNEQYLNRSYVREGRMRFYAGVPLVNEAGSVVGAICVFDRDARDGLSQEDKIYLQDLAAVVMDYLVTYTIKDRYRRAAKGLHGLMSFAEDGSASTSSGEHGHGSGTDAKDQAASDNQQRAQSPQDPEQDSASVGDNTAERRKQPSTPTETDGSTDGRRSVSDLQDSMLPASTRALFARAADIMRKTNDMSGVMFLDASYAAAGSQEERPTSAGKRCQILGFATEDQSSLKGDLLPTEMTPCESNFKWVLEHYPTGYSLKCDGTDDSVPSDISSPNEENADPVENLQPNERLQTVSIDRDQHTARVKTLIPNIKSALFLPLWDFDRGRWFAACFCWSTKTERALDGRLDLPFLKAFGHSIMQEVARLDAMATSQSKTTFLSSLSHELRTPLHGILSSVHLMRNSRLDSFQISMINSITVCGRTLLETVEHLLDHAERPQTSPKYSTTVSHGEHSISITSEPLDHHKPNTKISDMSKCNVGFVTEEVVETMIVGEAPYNPTIETNEDGDAVGDQTTRQAIARKRSRFVILDLRDYRGLGYRVSASSYGRIVMNLLGNAMKFTENGFVHISVRSEDLTEESGTIVLKIEDSGLGISTQFLQHAFEPFRKQNQHTAGTGVGLSVVKRILEDIGGQIDVTSVATKGTEVLVRLPLQRLPEEEGHDPKINPLPVAIEGLQGRKACILYQAPGRNDTPEQVSHQQTMKRYVTVLSETLSDVLKLDVYHSSVWDGSDETEVVICPEVSFESLQRVRTNAAKSGRRCPAIILVAMDILEAETLRTDARVKSGESIVESVTQPCGPYKLSIAIKACLFLYDCEGSPLSPSISTTNLSSGSWSSPQNPAIFGPRFGLSDPSLPIRAKSRPCIEEMIAPFVQDQSPPSPSQHEVDNNKKLHIEQALIVDDNAINRRLLAAWMKKHKVLFKEAKDGQQALDMYQESDGKFDTVLMDISMPVMDGMTATRYIREFEKEKELKSSHIIALTGLTSASAKFEAWTSGVDDFLTKPVDFKRLEKLMEAGRGGEGTGFMKEHGSIP